VVSGQADVQPEGSALYLNLPVALVAVPVLSALAAAQNLASVQGVDQLDGHTLAETAALAIVGVRVVQTQDRQVCTGVDW
jgi:hypothetical protein